MLDPCVLATADIQYLNVARWAKEEAWRYLGPLMGSLLPQRPPMNVAVCGACVEASMDLPVDMVPVGLSDSSCVRGVRYGPWVEQGGDHPRTVHVLWLVLPPKRRGPLLEAWKALFAEESLSLLFAGLVEGGSPGCIDVRLCGTKPPDLGITARAAALLGALVPAQSTSVRMRGYPAARGTDDYAQLQHAAAEAFGSDAPIRVRHCTRLPDSTLAHPVFDLELEGVPSGWSGLAGTDAVTRGCTAWWAHGGAFCAPNWQGGRGAIRAAVSGKKAAPVDNVGDQAISNRNADAAEIDAKEEDNDTL